MRIAIVCPYAWDRPGGVQSHIRSLAPALVRRGHDIIVIAPLAGPEPLGSEEYATQFVGRSVSVPANGSVAPIAFGPRLATRLREVIALLEPDVVQAHEPLIPSLSLLVVGASDAPVVGTFHAATDSSAGYRLARPYLERAAGAMAMRTAVSPAARALAARYFPGDYAIVPNGVDVGRFEHAPSMEFGPKKTILFLGRVEKRKGLEVLVRAVALLGDLDVRLAVVGEGPRVRRAERLALRSRIDAVWLGRVSEDEVPRAYRGADVYCAPNLGGESFGIVLLEAMAAGTPIVCSALDAFKVVARDAATFAAPGDVRGLAGALREALTSDCSDRVEAGRKVALGYDWTHLAGRLEEVFDEAVARRR